MSEDQPNWHRAADATLEVACASLCSADPEAPQVLSASLRALGHLAPALQSEALGSASVQLACRVLEPQFRSLEGCQLQALQLLRTLARKQPAVAAQGAVVAAAFSAAKDAAPSVDDLDEVSNTALAGRACLRALARANPGKVVPQVLEAVQAAAQSADAMDRAAAVHAVAFALSGAREAPPGWAVPLARALSDSAVWVRQATCEGAVLLAEELKPSPSVTQGLDLLLSALLELLPREPQHELLEKAALAASAILEEYSTDEAAAVLPKAPNIFQAMTKVSHALASGDAEARQEGGKALAALAQCLTSLAGACADTFAPAAPEAAKGLVALLRACHTGGNPAVLAACLEAAGAVIASAWSEQSFQGEKEELAAAARAVLLDRAAPTEARASAHGFYGRCAMASFEDFGPNLELVLPPALEALRQESGELVKHGRRRAVRTGGHEERLAATEAIGSYAAACSARFAPHLPAALPAVCSQARHPCSEVRAASAESLARMGRVLGDLAGGIPDSDRQAAVSLAEAVATSLVEILKAEGKALRCALQAKEDLESHPGFLALARTAAVSLSAAGQQRSEDVESEDDFEDEASLGFCPLRSFARSFAQECPEIFEASGPSLLQRRKSAEESITLPQEQVTRLEEEMSKLLDRLERLEDKEDSKDSKPVAPTVPVESPKGQKHIQEEDFEFCQKAKTNVLSEVGADVNHTDTSVVCDDKTEVPLFSPKDSSPYYEVQCCPADATYCAGCAKLNSGGTSCATCRWGYVMRSNKCVACVDLPWENSQGQNCHAASCSNSRQSGFSSNTACCKCGGGQGAATPFEYYVGPDGHRQQPGRGPPNSPARPASMQLTRTARWQSLGSASILRPASWSGLQGARRSAAASSRALR
ncbi:unnamed protein product [Effrenium voratum]|nr:unnamed protein product [Effrenium voratum]